MKNTQNYIGKESFRSTTGVKQGSATSCNLFTLYLDHTVKAVRTHGLDGFLQDSHTLLLMDDTVLLATSRDAMMNKLRLLHQSATEIDMVIHPNKSEFIVINSDDTLPFQVGDVTISHTDSYTYLGSPIMATSVADQVKEHIKSKQCHVWKYQSFVYKNRFAPYKVKRTVLQGAVNSSLLYSCESWLTNSLQCVDTAILGCIKSLLGVRTQTCTELVYIESGFCPASATVKNRQRKFMNKLFNRNDYDELPVGKAMQLAQQEKTPAAQYIEKLMAHTASFEDQARISIRDKVSSSTRTRMSTYRELNRDLDLHAVYDCKSFYIPEAARISFSRMRLSSHYLRIETGRWSRVVREQRLCICGEIQTETHVLINCPETEALRTQYQSLDYTNLSSLLSSTDHTATVNYVHNVLLKMERNY